MKKVFLKFCVFCLPILVYGQIDINVESGGQMYISKTAYVYVSNDGDVNIDASGELIMDSDSDEFSLLYVDGSSTGNTAEYRRWAASAASTRDLISPPVSGEAYNVFHARNAANIAAGTQGGPFLFGPYDNDGTTGAYYESAASDTYTLDAGIGYRAGTSGSGATLDFRGVISTTDVSVSISHSTVPNARFPETNLIGNPFTTYISATDVVNALVASQAADDDFTFIYAYDGDITGNDGATWTRINNLNAASFNIAPGQGFIVYSDDDGSDENLIFSADTRLITTGDDFLTGRTNNNPNYAIEGYFKLNIHNNSNASVKNTSELYFLDDHVSRGIDPAWDAGAFTIPQMGIATRLADNSSESSFDIQCLLGDELTGNSDLVIPIHVRANAGSEFTISITDTDLPSGSTIYLYDTDNETFTLLNEDNYVFTPSTTLNGIGRFYLRTSSNLLSNDQFAFSTINIISIMNAKQLKVEGQLTSDTDLKIFDISGRLINTFKLDVNTSNEHFIDVSNNAVIVHSNNFSSDCACQRMEAPSSK